MTQGFFQFNNSIINEIRNFATSSFDLLFMSGPKGSNKSETIEKVSKELQEQNLVFSHFCFENSVIDDFLLNFYDALRNFSLAQKISLKKFTTDNFKDKVSHYFKTIDTNSIVIVENFEKVEDNIEIVDFLSHLATYSNVKIIIVTRNSEKNLFRFKKIRMKTLQINSSNEEEFKSKLTVLAEPFDDELKQKIYEITKGLELYLKMSVKYCNTTGTLMKDFVSEYERKFETSKITYDEFLISKFISLTPNIYQGVFKFLCALSHPVSLNFLEQYKLGKASYVEYLTKNYLLNFFGHEIFVKDYFKKYIVNAFSIQEKANYYKNLAEIYENELTKSPKDRLLRLSRESIRKEIARFNSLIPTINSLNKNQKTFSYLGIAESNWHDEKARQKTKLSEKFAKIKERKNFLSKEKPTFTNILKNPQNLINEEKEKNKRFVIDLINSSRDYSKEYRFNDAIFELNRALETDEDNEFKVEILNLLAKNYEALNDFEPAKKTYKEALNWAIKTNDSRKCELKFAIASVDKNLFNIDSAKKGFIEIIEDENNSTTFRAKANIEIGEIQEANSNLDSAIRHYNEALSLAKGKNKEIVCKSYYRLAVLYDENQDTENAIKYYQKNYTTSSEPKENKYYSVSLTNLALIYIEQQRFKDASEFLKLALLYDSENNDLENMYFSQKELAKLYANIDETSAIGYYKQALDSANKLNDNFKIALVYFEAAELYYDKNQDEKALTNFLNAKEVLKTNPNDENLIRVNSRIKDIEMRLDKDVFNSIIEKYVS